MLGARETPTSNEVFDHMFHVSNLGYIGGNVPCDINGYVPEADDGPWDLIEAINEILNAAKNKQGV